MGILLISDGMLNVKTSGLLITVLTAVVRLRCLWLSSRSEAKEEDFFLLEPILATGLVEKSSS